MINSSLTRGLIGLSVVGTGVTAVSLSIPKSKKEEPVNPRMIGKGPYSETNTSYDPDFDSKLTAQDTCGTKPVTGTTIDSRLVNIKHQDLNSGGDCANKYLQENMIKA